MAQEIEGSDGKWIPNLFNWLVGFVIFYIWNLLGMIFAFFGMWQVPLDGMLDIYESLAPEGVSDGYTSNLKMGSTTMGSK